MALEFMDAHGIERQNRGAWVFVHPAAVAKDEKPTSAIPDFIAEYPFDPMRTFDSLLFGNCFQPYQGIRWHLAHAAAPFRCSAPGPTPQQGSRS